MSAQLNSTQIAQLLAQVQSQGIDLSNPQAITDFASSLTEVKPKATRVYKLPEDSNRCVARVWSKLGNGEERCSKPRNSKVDGCEYCIMHHKEALESTVPCQFSEDGNRKVGLFMGRIDEPIPYKNQAGEIVIIWNTPEMKATVADELKNGASYCKFIKEAGFKRVPTVHRVRKSTKPTTEPKAPVQPKPKGKAGKGSKKANNTGIKRPQNAYMFYIAAKRDELKAQLLADFIAANPNSTPDEQKKSNSIARVAQLAGSIWKSLSDDLKAPWKALEEADKARYTQAYKSTNEIPEQTQAEPGEATPISSNQPASEAAEPAEQLECEEIEINGITYLFDASSSQLYTEDCEPCGFLRDGQIVQE
jgi:hypothetical protein